MRKVSVRCECGTVFESDGDVTITMAGNLAELGSILQWSAPAETVDDVPKVMGQYGIQFPDGERDAADADAVGGRGRLVWLLATETQSRTSREMIGCRFYGPIPEPQ